MRLKQRGKALKHVMNNKYKNMLRKNEVYWLEAGWAAVLVTFISDRVHTEAVWRESVFTIQEKAHV